MSEYLDSFTMPFTFTVFGQPATKKNSAVMVARHATLLPSKAYRKYEKVFHNALRGYKDELQQAFPHYEGPVQMTALYWLKDHAHYPDLNGLIQATQDLISDEYKLIPDKATGMKTRMKVHRWLLSDDRIIKSLDGCRIAGIDKENPRVEIRITPLPFELEKETDPQLIRLGKARMETGLWEDIDDE